MGGYTASRIGNEAIEAIETAKEYFARDLEVATLSDEQRGFVKQAMETTREKLEKFLGYLPEDVVQKARKQVEDENDENMKEFVSETGDKTMINPVVLPWKKA